MEPTVLYEDPELLVVDKPAGMVVIPAREAEEAPPLRAWLEQHRGETLWVVHRIDRDTSGVVLFARTADAHRRLSVAFEQRRVQKTYLALTRGVIAPAEGRIDYALHPARKGKMRPAMAHEKESLDARTAYRVRSTWSTKLGPVALVEVSPLTGRQHQIRVHLRAKETPLLVDPLYGRCERVTGAELGCDPAVTVARLTLHASALTVPMADGAKRTFEAPLAPDLAALVTALGPAR